MCSSATLLLHWRFGIKQCCRATFPGIRDSVKDLLGKKMATLVRKFVRTHDMKLKEEIERWLGSMASSRSLGCLGHSMKRDLTTSQFKKKVPYRANFVPTV